MGLYGGEAVHTDETAMRGLQTAIADTVGPNSTLGSNAIIFSTCSRGEDIDPNVEMFARRYTLTRRMDAKWSWVRASINRIFNHYAGKELIGTKNDADTLQGLQPAPPPAEGHRTSWRPTTAIRGPIGHLIVATHEMAAAVDSNLVIYQHGEQPLPTMDVPIQHLKPLVKDVGIRARNKQAATVRQQLDGTAELDVDMFNVAANKLDKEEQKALRWVASLSAWTNEKKEEIGQAPSAKCDHCGQIHDSITHTIWTCQALKRKALQQGADKSIVELGDINLLPKPLLVGLPPALAADFDMAFWGGSLQNFEEALQQIVGKPAKANHASRDTRQLVQELHGTNPLLNARQIIQELRGGHVILDMAPIDKCEEAPPDKPNVYNDGSLKNPRNWYWGMGGYGVVWPARDLQIHPLTANEMDFAIREVDKLLVSLWGAMPGHKNSSTRAELAAGILALCGSGPVHQATDSEAYLKKANRILAGENLTRKTPWRLQKDGDLWWWFEHLARAKNLNSIRITKVKAHTTAKDVSDGVITAVDQHFNRLADHCADKGARAHARNAIAVAYAFATRHRNYQSLLERIHKHIVFMINLDRTQREELHRAKSIVPKAQEMKRKQQVNTKVASLLSMPDENTCIRIKMCALPPQVSIGGDYEVMQKVHDFMGRLDCEMADAQTSGSAWLEVLYLYELVHGPLLIPGQGDGKDLKIRASTKANVSFFKGLIKRVLIFCADKQTKLMFSPARVKHSRFSAIGYTNHVPAIRAKLALHQHHNMPVVAAMLSNRMMVSKNILERIKASNMQLVPAKLKLRKIPTWRTQPAVFQNLFNPNVCVSINQAVQLPEVNTQRPDTFKLICGSEKCKQPKQVAQRTLIKDGKWSVLTCNACKLPAKASRWLCECSKPWYMCPIHSSMGFACRANDKRKATKPPGEVDHSVFPLVHKTGDVDPTQELRSYVSEEVWNDMPKPQYRNTVMKTKCDSQQQYTIVDNKPCFTFSGTNARKPGVKRHWCDESAELLQAISRKREASSVLGCFESPSNSMRKEIGNASSRLESNDGMSAGIGPPVNCSPKERMQAIFRAKFARTAGQPFDPPSDPVEVSHAAPTVQGKQHEITRDNRWAPPQVPVEQICPMRVKRKAPTASIRVAGVKWGKRTSKEAMTAP